MRLRLEMDALSRLFDMLLFVSIVRHFFCVYRLSKFCLLVDTVACGGKEGLFALWWKNTSHRSGDFSAKRQKNSPVPLVLESEQARLPELIVSHNLELTVAVKTNDSILALKSREKLLIL